ncbi:glycoside hydrolase domain-containing protein [Pedobacter hiemivivus]|uniref:Glycoside hydrolase 123-like N-terminal domain-containing protein n=1 Tax=Pedobacter hiemivivus TaxID=2530454 RepID=A0A4R0N8V7_9SPHI|nr:glycoside hydrolase domain-containing protein [Pedobacter hiemivivus]TCC96581.1 hypothetical protein EZ444_11445 [Pedobacter hiemivivus]
MKHTIALFVVLLLVKNATAQKNTKPYAPLVVKEKSITLPGKQLDVNTDGFPAMIQTSFDLVTEPIHFHVINALNHKDIKWKNGAFNYTSQKPDKVSWSVKNTSDSLTMDVDGLIKADGKLAYTVKITALNDINLDNIRMHIPFTTTAAKFVKGLGQKEELRPEAIEWKWSTDKAAEAKVWVGDVTGGLQFELTDNQHKKIPASWANDGHGGIHIEQKGKAILADNYSGEHHLKKGDVLYYNFSMLITPDTKK